MLKIIIPLLAVGVIATVVVLGTNRLPSTAPAPPASNPAAGPVVSPRYLPAAVDIPAIGAHSTLIETGINGDQTIAIPPLEHPEQASWYQYSPAPGEIGPAVILGHVNAYGKPGIFVHLDKLKPGDEVIVDRSNAPSVRFKVTRVDVVDKAHFPTSAVYGDTDHPALRLLTCGGVLDAVHHNYLSNVIVYADGV